MSETTDSGEKLRIRKTFDEVIALLGRDMKQYAIVGAIFVTLPTLISNLLVGDGRNGELWSVNLVTYVPMLAGSAALTQMFVDRLGGQKPDWRKSCKSALKILLPFMLLNSVLFLAIWIGFILLVAPGLFLLSLWAVVSPVYVNEKPAFSETFKRSAELTKGRRWKVLFVLLAWLAALLLVGVLTVPLSAGAMVIGLGAPIVAVITTLSTIAWTAMQTVLYGELRRLKEGVSLKGVAAVFD